MLSVLPREREEIRASQPKMLEREEKLEKKESLVPQLVVVRGYPRRPRVMRVMIKKKLRRILSQILRGWMQKMKIRNKSSQVLLWIKIKV